MRFTTHYLRKPACLFFVIGLFFNATIAQENVDPQTATQASYLDLRDDPNANFFEIKSAFETFWEGREITRGCGYKPFMRWLHQMEPLVGPSGEFPSNEVIENSGRIYTPPSAASMSNPAWQALGPVSRPPAGPYAYAGGVGRINKVRVDPNNANVYFGCAPGGGIWKTTDAGANWNLLYPDASDEIPSIGFTDIAIDHSNSNILYAAAGDDDGLDTYGLGILKSTDGGITWTQSYAPFQSGYTMGRILISPTNSNIIVAAARYGILRSTDAGVSWSYASGTSGIRFRDIEFQPGNGSVIYASSTAGFWKSSDSGSTWSQRTLPAEAADMQRNAIAVTPDDPNRVYMIASANSNSAMLGFFRSNDAGETWSTMTGTSPNLLGYSETGEAGTGQGWYDLCIDASHTNADVVIVGGVNVWRTTDGGSSWGISGHWLGNGGAAEVHADIHGITYDGSTLLVGCDGGVYKSANDGTTYSDITNGMSIGQFYQVGVAQDAANLVAGGLQDNGTILMDGSEIWTDIRGADGFEVYVMDNSDFDGGQLYYGCYQYGAFYRIANGTNFVDIAGSNGTGVNAQGDWETPFEKDPNADGTVYIAKDGVWKSTDFGSNWTFLGGPGAGNLENLAVSWLDPNRIYVSKSSALYTSSNGGSSFTAISGLPNVFISDILIDPTDASRVFVSQSTFTGTQVHVSTDAGATWSAMDSGLPNAPAYCLTYRSLSDDEIYAGTGVGIYKWNGSSWDDFNVGMPNVAVYDLEIQETENELYAGTYGRGMWSASLAALGGCTDPTACNYDAEAIEDDGSCATVDNCGVCDGDNSTCAGCIDTSACNYVAGSGGTADCVYASGCNVCGTDGTVAPLGGSQLQLGPFSASLAGLAGTGFSFPADGSASSVDITLTFDNAASPSSLASDILMYLQDPAGVQVEWGGRSATFGMLDLGELPVDWQSTAPGVYTTNIDVSPGNLSGSGTWVSGFNNGWSSSGTVDYSIDYTFNICTVVDGCLDATACNYDASANSDDGTCEYSSCAGCTEPTACNYDNTATINDGSCGTDADADGICDDTDNCTDVTACNYNDAANGACLTLDECGVCGGSGIPAGDCDCFGNVNDACDVCGGTGTDADADGICDDIDNCTDLSACNFDGASGGSGDCTTLSLEEYVVHTSGTLAGQTTYRLYAVLPSSNDFLSAVNGEGAAPLSITTTTSFYQDANGGVDGTAINAAFFQFVPDLEYDSWVTIGHAPEDGTAQINLTTANSPNQNWVAAFEAGGNIIMDDIFGGLWSIFNDGNSQGKADEDKKVLIAQLTTNGVITAELEVQYFPDYGCCANGSADGTQETQAYVNLSTSCGSNIPCEFPDACGVCGGTGIPTGDCDCNGNINDACGVCGGNGTDTDADGICDDIDNCTDLSACNYNEEANGTCLTLDECGVCGGAGIPAGDCDCNGNQADALNVCGGDCAADVDGDGVCDTDEIPGCTNETACNFNPNATDNDGNCTFEDGICDTCVEGLVVDNDSDDDGICDDIDNCSDLDACNYNDQANGTCLTLDACDVCGGAGIPAGDCDCNGNINDACGVCGGNGTDTDADGICDDTDNCTDLDACNYNDQANGTCLTLDACGVCGGAGIPAGDCDCNGNINDACGVCGGNGTDTDADGICDDTDNCTDLDACNYNDQANGTCLTLDECGVCGGTGIPTSDCDCNGNVNDACGVCGGTGVDADADGICDDIDNCTDLTACNFDGTVNFGCVTIETVAIHTDGDLAGRTTYRLYAQLGESTDYLSAIYGEGAEAVRIETTTNFFQDPAGSVTADNINANFYEFVPTLPYDSWVTIGHTPEDGTAQVPITITNSPNQNWSSTFEAGGNIVIDDLFGGLWSILNDGNTQGLAGEDKRVLIAQLTTDGTVTASIRGQYFPDYGCCLNGSANGLAQEIFMAELGDGCPNPLNETCSFLDACGVCGGTGTDLDSDGICDDVDNCEDITACNFNDTDNVTCLFTDACGVCGGSGIPIGDCDCFGNVLDDCDVCGGTGTDIDSDGICDDVDNCEDITACNFNDTDNVACLFTDACGVCGGSGIPDGDCDCFGNVLDDCGICGGTGTDIDSDGICDDVDNCEDITACNFNDTDNVACLFTDACGVCGGSGIPAGDCDCFGNQLDALNNCGGTCLLDTDADGICDDIDNCTDVTACNYDDVANGLCSVIDECGICGGNGIPEGACDCLGNQVDACGLCGGTGTDVDNDGICDNVDNCEDLTACNFDGTEVNATCQYLDECGVCGGNGIPSTDCDCNGNILDACGVCGGCGLDIDNDGICDDSDNCTDVSACNFDDVANVPCLQLDVCNTCGGAGIPAGNCDCNGNIEDAVGVCGGSCTSDLDGDGICDDTDNCNDTAACNYDDPANETCSSLDACGVCGGSGIPDGDCDCLGNQLDACGICGGSGLDADADGICDDIDNCTDITACNFSDQANGTCQTTDECGVCGGTGIPVGDCDCNGNVNDLCGVCGGSGTDVDADGICDSSDNCTDTNACNFNDPENKACLFIDACGVCGGTGIPAGDCDCNGNQLDALGICGGACSDDADGDGICDDTDNCLDLTACNYNDAANVSCLVLDECGTCGGSGIPIGDCDCFGNTVDACGVCGGTGLDVDADGICDDTDNCTDVSACNYNDGTNDACAVLDECGVCGGSGIPAGDCDCLGNQLDACNVCGGCGIDVDGDGLCDDADNCTDTSACNYDDPANEACAEVDVCGICGGNGIPAGDCDCSGNAEDALGVCGGSCAADLDGDGICDDADNCTDTDACNYSDVANGTCETWDECGVCGGSGIPTGDCDCSGSQVDVCGVCGGTGVDSDADGICDANDNCIDLSACNYGSFSNSACQFLDECGVCGGSGIPEGDCDCFGNTTDVCGVCGGNGTDVDADGICDNADNCTDTSACNFNDTGNGPCAVDDECGVCGGGGIPAGDCDCNGNVEDALGVCGGDCTGDSDSDGICDVTDNCFDLTACNYNDAANGTCLQLDECGTCGGSGIPVGDCDCFGNVLDACGDCGGTGTDSDSDGICDTADNCSDLTACNFNDPSNGACEVLDECGVCGGAGIPIGDCDCDGNALDACGVCGGCGLDLDGDGLCDDADNCTDLSACNFDDVLNTPCHFVDVCGICGGTGIPAGDCDCFGNQLDVCGICGGTGVDLDGDGLCDNNDNCTDPTACNFASPLNQSCTFFDECGVCGGSGIPAEDCDCDGNQLDACGVCGGTGTDVDGDGVCDNGDNCTDLAACNFNDFENASCLFADACGVCGGSGIPAGDCDCFGNQTDACGICGGSGTDVDADGICDDADNCTNTNACNFNDAANTACAFIDECGVCGGPGIAPEACDCDGNSLDALDVCGGACAADLDNDGICDDADNCTDLSACNFSDPANVTCLQVDECGVCGGSGIPAGDCDCLGNQLDECGVCGGSGIPIGDCDCFGNQIDILGVCGGGCTSDSDQNGVCDDQEVQGCDDPIACNYDPVATQNDGSCAFLGAACDDGNAGTFNDVYTNCSAPDFGCLGEGVSGILYAERFDDEPFIGYGYDGNINNAANEPEWSITFGSSTDYFFTQTISGDTVMAARDTDAEVTWLSREIDITGATNVTLSMNLQESGRLENSDYIYSDIIVDGVTSAVFFQSDDFTSGTLTEFPIPSGSVLQVKVGIFNNSNGEYHYFDDIIVNGDANNCEDSDFDGICNDVDNCSDLTACNYVDPLNAACLFNDACGVCGGGGVDLDADGICDDSDNCTDVTACNFSDPANGPCAVLDECGVCGGSGIPAGDCDCFGNQVDGCGICGGSGTDSDADGICDDADNCADISACNFNDPANGSCLFTDECGVCGGSGIPVGDCDCFGNQTDACGVCGGNGTDLDGDGICDNTDNCTDVAACNYNDPANGPCAVIDACGVCGGSGIPDGDCDCNGNVNDACGVCGGAGADADADGICDDTDNCTDITACNFNDPANGSCLVTDECGVCGGAGIPDGDCDCFGNQLDACGQCGGTGTDSDADGICDTADNCTDLTACNYNNPNNPTCAMLDVCGTCGGDGIPEGDCDCFGSQLDACGACGGNGIDLDNDGLCDEEDNCADLSACNFDDVGNMSCLYADACGVCGGCGIADGACDCEGTQPDAIGVCGGDCAADLDGDGVCDTEDNCFDLSACNFADPGNAACAVLDECGICGGTGIPPGDCDCNGNQLDACGTCGGTGTDVDADGICDDSDNCTDLTACNFSDPANTTCTLLDACGVCGGNGIPAGDCDCDGNVEDACGVCGGNGTDIDVDGICDGTDNCTDVSACNFNSADNQACAFIDACGVCGGGGIPLGDCNCDGDALDACGVCGGTGTDTDGDGICDDLDNCTDVSACNFDDPANVTCATLDECGVCGGSGIPDGDCDCLGNTIDGCGVCGGSGTDADGDGLCDDTDNCTDVTACNFNDPANGSCLVLDACGVCGGEGIPAGDCDCFGNQTDACGVCGGLGTDDDADGICDDIDNCTDIAACNFDDEANGPCAVLDACGVCGGCGIPAGACDCDGTMPDALGICGGTCANDIDGDGICDDDDACTDLSACNFDDPANGTCAALDECGVCGGSGIPSADCDCFGNQVDACGECGGSGIDVDADGICDNLDNCTDVAACNYDDEANGACNTLDECGVCGGNGIPNGDCDCAGNTTDGCGVCGGNGTDIDGDGLCDNTDNCTDVTACNFNDVANGPCTTTDECGACGGSGIPPGDCDCNGNQIDACGICGGTGVDLDGDGICDDTDNCTDVTACNFDDTGNAPCAVFDECGVCGGSGIPAGDCDCDGNQLDACGECGGTGTDVDADGICDNNDNCTDVAACNFDDPNNDICAVLDECGVCGGSGIPSGDCDCDGNQTDGCGVCGGSGTDADGDGLCDPLDNCVNTDACNFDDPSNTSCLFVDECGVCGGCGIADGNCDCDGNQLDVLGVCGGDCTADIDGDGLCDDADNCTDLSACNFDDPNNEACAVLDECGVCGGNGVPVGDCDCDGNQLDALGVCGGLCLADNDQDGICDDLEVPGCTNPLANNYDANATDDDGSCEYDTESFLGIVAEPYALNSIADGIMTWRIYAQFADPSDQLVSVFGDSDYPLLLSTTTDFHQEPLGGFFAQNINPLLFQDFPTLEYDSWLTIGSDDNSGTQTQAIGLNLFTFETGGNLVSGGEDGGSWFVTPNTEPTAYPDADGKVLIAQVTTSGTVTFNGNILYRTAEGTSPIARELTLVFPNECFSDLNQDGAVNINDLLIVLADYGCIASNCTGDTNNNGVVGIDDILVILGTFGNSCY